MNLQQHIRDHEKLGLVGPGDKTFIATSANQFLDIIGEISLLPNLVELTAPPFDTLGTVSVAANSSKVDGASTFFSHYMANDGFIEFNDDGNFYQLKKIATAVELEMYGGIISGAPIASTANIKSYLANKYTIQLQGGLTEYNTAASLDMTPLNGYDITLQGIGRQNSLLQLNTNADLNDLILPNNGFITLKDFTIGRRFSSGGKIRGGNQAVLKLHNFGTSGGGSSNTIISINSADVLRGLIIDGYYSEASANSVPHRIEVEGFIDTTKARLRGTNSDEELQLIVRSDIAYDQPWLIDDLNILHTVGSLGNYNEGLLHFVQNGPINQDKKVVVTNSKTIVDDVIVNGNMIHFEDKSSKSGTGRMQSWVTHCHLNDLQGNTGPVGINADGDHDVKQSNNFMNVTTPTSVANGALIT